MEGEMDVGDCNGDEVIFNGRGESNPVFVDELLDPPRWCPCRRVWYPLDPDTDPPDPDPLFLEFDGLPLPESLPLPVLASFKVV